MSFIEESSHRRLNPLTGDWVLVSPHRANRPWLGEIEHAHRELVPQYDPSCYLCPGNVRANGQRNPTYRGTFAFDNDFPSLVLDTSQQELDESGILVARGEPGTCRVLCFTPRHDRTLARMEVGEITQVVTAWRDEYVALSARPGIGAVQIFENRGEMMGASNPHPHGQIWSTASIPNEVKKETESLGSWAARDACLLCEYAILEERERERIVYANQSFLAVVPFWATWPFETMILPRNHITGIDAIDEPNVGAFAEALSAVAVCYDNLFESAFPYSMGIHQRPTDGPSYAEWHLHAHFYPPLLRSATVRKFMVGFELLAEPQRDITPEDAASRLRHLDARHYLDRPAS